MTIDNRPLRWWEQTHGVPRRFGVGALLAVTVLYAMTFSLATSMSRDVADRRLLPIVVSILFVWLTTVAVSQALFFGGRRPRLASLLAGAGLFLFCAEPVIAWYLYREASRPWNTLAALVSLAAAPFVGAVLGYLAGGAVAGVFLLLAAGKKK